MEITKEQFSGLQEVDSILESIFTSGENSILLVTARKKLYNILVEIHAKDQFKNISQIEQDKKE